jgi:hypothetical protein
MLWGGVAEKDFANALLELVDKDENISVKYGSIRSLIEIASRSETISKKIISNLTKRIPRIVNEPKLLVELSSCVFLAKNTIRRGWTEELVTLFYKLMNQYSNAEDIERWSNLSSELLAHEQSALQRR